MYSKRIIGGFKMKYKSISISNYFELVKPQYVFFKLTPHSSCRNNSSDKLAQLVNKLYIDFIKSNSHGKKYNTPKLSPYIAITDPILST